MLRLFTVAILLMSQFSLIAQVRNISWAEAKQHEETTINCYWFDSKPFIYPTANGPAGIEYDLINEFSRFVDSSYGLRLNINWIRCESFKQVYDTIKNTSIPNSVAASAFSITSERKQEVQFTPGYLPDISVIVSDYSLPIVYNETEFDSIFNSMTAITIRQTTFEQHLSSLKTNRNLDFGMKYISSSGDIISAIARAKNSFGYIDLPTYLTALQDTINVKRQYLFSFKNIGIGFALPIHSDWNEPFEAFFADASFSDVNSQIIGKHFGPDVPYLINNIASGLNISSKDEVLLLTKEKEVQSKELINSALKIQRENLLNKGFIIGIAVLLVIAGFTFNQYRLKVKANGLLNLRKVEIENQNQQLKELNEEKNNLINILAHDLRAPINNIAGLTELLKIEQTSADREQYIEQIERAINRLGSMIKKILDVESIESKSDNINNEPIDLSAVINQVVDDFKDAAKEKEIGLNLNIESDASIKVRGDELFLIQVFENLVSNALKFSPKKTAITVNLKKVDQKVRCYVTDQGPGISKIDQEKLFNKFQRLSAKPTQGEQSTGLGLSIVKKYVELMGGKVWCESTMGQGASFIVEFDAL